MRVLVVGAGAMARTSPSATSARPSASSTSARQNHTAYQGRRSGPNRASGMPASGHRRRIHRREDARRGAPDAEPHTGADPGGRASPGPECARA